MDAVVAGASALLREVLPLALRALGRDIDVALGQPPLGPTGTSSSPQLTFAMPAVGDTAGASSSGSGAQALHPFLRSSAEGLLLQALSAVLVGGEGVPSGARPSSGEGVPGCCCCP